MDVAHTDAVGLAGRQESQRCVRPDPTPTPPFKPAMRKQGLVHLHALCTLLREHLRNREDVEHDALQGDDQTASPAAIHRPKAQHRRAVDELATEIAAAVDPEGETAAADSRHGTGTTAEGE